MYKPYECLVTAKNEAVAVRFRDSAYPDTIFQLGLDEYYQMLGADEELAKSFLHHNLLSKNTVVSELKGPPYWLTREDYEYDGAAYTIPSENPISPDFYKTSCYLYTPNDETANRIKDLEESIYFLAYKLYGPRIAMEACQIKPSFLDGDIIFTLNLFTSLQELHVREIIEDIEEIFPSNPFVLNSVTYSSNKTKVKLTLSEPLKDSSMRVPREEVKKMIFDEVNLGGNLKSFVDLGNFATNSENNKISVSVGASRIIMLNCGEKFASLYNSISISRTKEFPFYSSAFYALEDFVSEILEEDFYEEVCDTTERTVKVFFENNLKKAEIAFPLKNTAKEELVEGLSSNLSIIVKEVSNSIIKSTSGSVRIENKELVMTIYFV